MINLWGIKLHTYGLLIGIGVLLAWEVAVRLKRIEKNILDKLLIWLLFFGVFGARLYHVIDYWEYYSQNFLLIFYIWNGGLGIWGGILGGSLGVYLFSVINKLRFWDLMDGVVVGVPVAQTVGRLGNWANGELYGKNGEPLFAWEGGLNLILFLILWNIAKNQKPSGFLTGVYLIGYGVIRIFLENFRDGNMIWKLGSIPTAIAFGLIAVGVGLRLISQKRS